jgi:hypothetical protein
MLTSRLFGIYGVSMFRKVIACSVLSLWLGLLGVEFSEELGLFSFTNEQTDQAADNALASLGYTIQLQSGQDYIAATHFLSQLSVVHSIDILPNFESLSLSYKHRLAATVPKNLVPIFKLCLNFRL